MADYEITDYDGLQAMKDDLAGNYTLMNNIDASASRTKYPVGATSPGEYYGFLPIGDSSTAFTGTFDGDEYTISDLYINRGQTSNAPGYADVGLFGRLTWTGVPAGFIKDVTLKDIDIKAKSNMGGLVARLVGETSGGVPTISNCHITGILRRKNNTCGGMVGNMYQSSSAIEVEFSDCTTSVSIISITTQGGSVGGFVGITRAAQYTDCLAGGTITIAGTGGTIYCGGFAGSDETTGYSKRSAFIDCSASVAIIVSSTASTGINSVGGFIGGYKAGSNGFDCDTCYAAGTIIVLATGTYIIGGFIGFGYIMVADECAVNVAISAPNATDLEVGGFSGVRGAYTNCYSRSSVCIDGIADVDADLGGFCGKQYISGDSYVNCYSIGEINTDSTKAGGFLGTRVNGTVTACHFDTDTSGTSTAVGDGSATGITGNTTAEMKLEATYSGWAFPPTASAIWDIPTYIQPAISRSNLTVWLSEDDDYENFEAGVKDADSFSLGIPSGNEIQWLGAMKALFVGTNGDEWEIASSELDTPITPTNFTVERQSKYGSKYIQPVQINEQLLFVDFVGRKVREFTYSDAVRKFVAPDLTALSEHITESGIVGIAHQRNPDSILWVWLDDGSLISMTYEREQEVVGWAKHPIDGTVQSVCIIPSTNEDIVQISVRRNINNITYEGELVTYEGATVTLDKYVTYIEKMMPRDFGTDIDDAFFVDAGITYDSTAVSTITGLDHLDGETVKVLGDGVVFDDAVVHTGQITTKLDETTTNVSTCQVGLAFTSKLEPLKPVIMTQMGTTAASIVSAKEMGVSLLNSAGVKYGVSDDDLFDIDLDYVSLVNLSEIDGLFTGTVVVSVDSGFSLENPLIISSDSPLPLTVRALIPKLDVTGR